MFSYLTESKAKKPRWDYSDLRSAIQEGRKGNEHFSQTDIKTPVNYKYILEEKKHAKNKVNEGQEYAPTATHRHK